MQQWVESLTRIPIVTTEPSADIAATCEAREPKPGAVLAVLIVGTVLAPLDSSIVNIALPSIAAQFGERLGAVSWVTSAYLLTTAALLLSMGRLGDVWGLRRLYAGGLVLFGVGSAACALAPSLALLIAARILQGVGASMLFAAGPALVARTFPPNRRGWALGYIALAVSLGLTLGPALGGLLVGSFGWPSIFLINIPLAAIAAAISWRLLEDECLEGQTFDVPGAVLAGAALLLLLLGLGEAERAGVFSVQVIGPLVGAVVALALFIAWEKRAADPMVNLVLFESRAFSVGIATATIAYLSLLAVTFTFPFYLLRVLGIETSTAGLILTVTPLSMAVLAPIAGRASDRMGGRTLATAGLSILAFGLLTASFLDSRSGVVWVAGSLLLIGSGMAIFQTPNTSSVLRATPRWCVGVGSAFVAEARNVGMAIGIALTAAIVGASVGGAGLPEGTGRLSADIADAFVRGMAWSLRVAVVIALGGALLSWFGREADQVEAQDDTH